MKPTYEELEEKVKILEEKTNYIDELQEILINNQNFLDILLNTIPNPVFFKDTKGVYQKANDAFSKTILGIPKERIVGKNLFELPDVIPYELAVLYNKKDNELFENPGTQVYEGDVKCSNKEIRTFYFYKATVEDNSGEIIGLVGVMLDVTELKKNQLELDKKNQELKSLSYKDSLTGIYNRRKFDEIFPQKISTFSREGTILNFVLLDVDNFKLYNDTYGHDSGDKVLKIIAETIQGRLARNNDSLFRIGGEEFGLFFESKNEKIAFEYINKIREDIKKLDIEHKRNEEHMVVTISCGLISIINRDIDANTIFINADKCLYRAKKIGRNIVCNDLVE